MNDDRTGYPPPQGFIAFRSIMDTCHNSRAAWCIRIAYDGGRPPMLERIAAGLISGEYVAAGRVLREPERLVWITPDAWAGAVPSDEMPDGSWPEGDDLWPRWALVCRKGGLGVRFGERVLMLAPFLLLRDLAMACEAEVLPDGAPPPVLKRIEHVDHRPSTAVPSPTKDQLKAATVSLALPVTRAKTAGGRNFKASDAKLAWEGADGVMNGTYTEPWDAADTLAEHAEGSK